MPSVNARHSICKKTSSVCDLERASIPFLTQGCWLAVKEITFLPSWSPNQLVLTDPQDRIDYVTSYGPSS